MIQTLLSYEPDLLDDPTPAECEAIELAREGGRWQDEQTADPYERQQAFEEFMGWARS